MFVHRAAGNVHRVCLFTELLAMFTECVCSQSCWQCSHGVFVHRAAGDVRGAGVHQAAVQEPPGGGGAQRLLVPAQARHPAHQAH